MGIISVSGTLPNWLTRLKSMLASLKLQCIMFVFSKTVSLRYKGSSQYSSFVLGIMSQTHVFVQEKGILKPLHHKGLSEIEGFFLWSLV